MNGLIIKPKWADLILSGKKTWEIRDRQTHILGTIGIIKSGSGLIYGTVDLVDCMLLTPAMYGLSSEEHRIPSDVPVTYKQPYAWVLKNPITYPEPRPYKHPQGAVIWVELPELTWV
ncbi:ASCH domain-containing protein [Paenibacillus macquariensis]|uniref:Predicted transcriptional regulator, contains an HTH and PUA-like domains n=1 Tax=Paenibacillus macquariensis TaxID=948756 RepID=A0ABY1K0C2_9BACL|nr:ASCH domain-containing protein [Paenibacillus macquariensis]MEC0091460.1 ASCH domain-containing protein [Paenibacillus macquariensis]OAB38139.1 hypothetical protein PMSM_03095 [Paenibacillus macquariensis subsp. macquariensis]SIR07210.1 Predicted transcriptional regulator, contains an HTH and PUA-like domains [Paenibacillus macquariensis]